MPGNMKETTGLKALAAMYLQGNIRGNNKETCRLQKKEPDLIKIEKFEFRGTAEIITPGGESLWVVTEKDALKLLPSGAVFFTPHEIKHLSEAGKKEAEAVLKVKQIFGNDVRVKGVKELSEGKIRARFIDLFPIGGIMLRATLENDKITILGLDELNEVDRQRAGEILTEYPVCIDDFE